VINMVSAAPHPTASFHRCLGEQIIVAQNAILAGRVDSPENHLRIDFAGLGVGFGVGVYPIQSWRACRPMA
jgi:hypothetical protein